MENYTFKYFNWNYWWSINSFNYMVSEKVDKFAFQEMGYSSFINHWFNYRNRLSKGI